MKLRPNPGVGVANVHFETWKIVEQYYADSNYNLGDTLAPRGQPVIDAHEFVSLQLTTAGSVEAAAAVSRFLADYRTGSNNLPKKTTHFNDLSTTDMAQVFGAYRNGVKDLSCFEAICGFESIKSFQTKKELGPEAQQALPYFEYYNLYFVGK